MIETIDHTDDYKKMFQMNEDQYLILAKPKTLREYPVVLEYPGMYAMRLDALGSYWES
jgi:hypothetical protein